MLDHMANAREHHPARNEADAGRDTEAPSSATDGATRFATDGPRARL